MTATAAGEDTFGDLTLFEFARRYRHLGPSMKVAPRAEGLPTRIGVGAIAAAIGVASWITLTHERQPFYTSAWFYIGLLFSLFTLVIAWLLAARRTYKNLAFLYETVETGLWILSLTMALLLDVGALALVLSSPLLGLPNAILFHSLAIVVTIAALSFVSQARSYTPAILTVDKRRPLRRRLSVMTAAWLAAAAIVLDILIGLAQFSEIGAAGLGLIVASMTFLLGVYTSRRRQAWTDSGTIVKALDDPALALVAMKPTRAVRVGQRQTPPAGREEVRKAYLALDRACSGDGRMELSAIRNTYVDTAIALVLRYIGSEIAELDTASQTTSDNCSANGRA